MGAHKFAPCLYVSEGPRERGLYPELQPPLPSSRDVITTPTCLTPHLPLSQPSDQLLLLPSIKPRLSNQCAHSRECVHGKLHTHTHTLHTMHFLVGGRVRQTRDCYLRNPLFLTHSRSERTALI